MSLSNWETFHAAYLAADQKTKSIISSSLIPECVAESIAKFEIGPQHQKTMVQIFSDKILGILDESSATNALRAAGIPAAKVIHDEITNCMNTKTPSVADTSLETPDSPEADSVSVPIIRNNQQQTQQTLPIRPTSQSANQPSTPAATQHQETFRVPPSAPPTLAQSYRQPEPEPTYTSTQAAILREGRTTQQPSKSTTPTEPRWGDD